MSEPHEVECPMPDCTEALYLTVTTGMAISPHDLSIGFIDIEGVTTWKVECLEGHVVLLPTTDETCPDEEADETTICHHIGGHESVDGDRTFRISDMARLRALVERLATP